MALRDNISVMVVDDMATSRSLIIMALEEMGIRKIDFRKDGAEALHSLVAQPVHLVISDMNMPGLSGLELLGALRQNRNTQRMGFILITGTPTPEILQKGQQLGLNNLIRKPFTTATVKASIERVVGPL